jgi:hypothetical protein
MAHGSPRRRLREGIIGAVFGSTIPILNFWLPGHGLGVWHVVLFAVCVPGGFVIGFVYGRQAFEHPVFSIFDWLGL